MSVTEGAESAELLRCARSLHRPVLPVLRFGDSLPRHLEAPLRLQPTGLTRSIRAAVSAGTGAGTEAGTGTGTGGGTAPAGLMRQVPVHWRVEPVEMVSDVLFHEAIREVHSNLQQLQEQERTVLGSSAALRYSVQHGLFSSQQEGPPLLPQPQQQQQQRELPARENDSSPADGEPGITGVAAPAVAIHDSDGIAESAQQRQHSPSPSAAQPPIFPELISARVTLQSEDLAALNQRVASLERASGRGSGGAYSFASLEARLAALEAAAVSAPPATELAARLTALEQGDRPRPGRHTDGMMSPAGGIHVGAAGAKEGLDDEVSIYDRLAKAEAVSSRLEMVLDVVAANEKERLKHAHSLRMLQESNDHFAEQLQAMSAGFLDAMAKMSTAFGDISAAAGAAATRSSGLATQAPAPQAPPPLKKTLSARSSAAPAPSKRAHARGDNIVGTDSRLLSITEAAAEKGEGIGGVIARSVHEGLALAQGTASRAAQASAELQEQAHRIAQERQQMDSLSLGARVELGLVRELVAAATLPFGAALQVVVREEVETAMQAERSVSEDRWAAASRSVTQQLVGF
eukprot:COSAG06_NODE_1019_length_11057_cov_5.386293_3_plen_575_part_00